MLFRDNMAELWNLNQQKKTTALKAARCRENWPKRLVNNFGQKIHGTHGSWVPWKLRQVGIFTAIRHSYKTLVVKKSTVLTAATCNENWLNWLVNNFSKKSTALTAAWCRENQPKKVCFFKAIRDTYKTLVRKKTLHSSHQEAVRFCTTD